MKFVDEKMAKYGYVKIVEDSYGVTYEKLEKQGYNHVIAITRKISGKHLMQSYDKECINVQKKAFPINECAGVEIPILLLMWLKAKYLARKYHWIKISK